MKIKKSSIFLVLFSTFLFCTNAAFVDRISSNELINLKGCYVNSEVTAVGLVVETVADQDAAMGGRYTITDDSTTWPLTVKTNYLSPVGKSFTVSGYVESDPKNVNLFLLCEGSRASPEMSNTMKYLLYGGGILFLVLIIIFISVRIRSKTWKSPQDSLGTRPSSLPGYPDSDRTQKITPSQLDQAPVSDESQAVVNLGAELFVREGDDQGKNFILHKRATTIGRAGARKNDVELIDDTVSKQQATILCDITNKQFFIKNESTTNATKVNNQFITEMAVLQFGDMIEMGSTLLLFKKTGS